MSTSGGRLKTHSLSDKPSLTTFNELVRLGGLQSGPSSPAQGLRDKKSFECERRGNTIYVAPGRYRFYPAAWADQVETVWEMSVSGFLYAEYDPSTGLFKTATDSAGTTTMILRGTSLPSVEPKYLRPLQRYTVATIAANPFLRPLPGQSHIGDIELLNPYPAITHDYYVLMSDFSGWSASGAGSIVWSPPRLTE